MTNRPRGEPHLNPPVPVVASLYGIRVRGLCLSAGYRGTPRRICTNSIYAQGNGHLGHDTAFDVRPSQEIDPPGGLVRGRKCFAALSSLVGFEGLYVGFGVLAGGARREEHLAVRESGAVSTQTLQRKTLTRPCRIYTDCKERI